MARSTGGGGATGSKTIGGVGSDGNEAGMGGKGGIQGGIGPGQGPLPMWKKNAWPGMLLLGACLPSQQPGQQPAGHWPAQQSSQHPGHGLKQHEEPLFAAPALLH
jgi:hypothetical protein